MQEFYSAGPGDVIMHKNLVKIIAVLLFLFTACGQNVKNAASPAVSGEQKPVQVSPGPKKLNVVILPLLDKSDVKKYASSRLVQSIVFKSLNTFIRVIPSVSIPAAEETAFTNPDNDSLNKIADDNNADFIIYGDYSLAGGKANPKAGIKSLVWSKTLQKNVFEKSYLAPTDMEIFDTIDKMILDNASAILNTRVSYSTIAFSGFKGNLKLSIYLNGQFLTNTENDGFSYNLRVPSDTRYLVEIRKTGENTNIYQAEIVLNPDQVSNIGYTVKHSGTLTMWVYFAGSKREWEARKPDIENKFGIKLDIRLVVDRAGINRLLDDDTRQLRDSIGSGKAPDIIEGWFEHNKLMNSDPGKSLVLPLEEFALKSEVFANVPAGRVAFVRYGGHIYGLPHDVHPLVLIYNDTIWKEAGVDVSEIQTWDGFFEAAKKLAGNRNEGRFRKASRLARRMPEEGGEPLHYALPSGNAGLEDTMFMIWQTTGAGFLDKTGKPDFTSPEFVSFVKKWKKWYETGAFINWDWPNFWKLLKEGSLASYVSPDWWVSQVDEASLKNGGIYQFRAVRLPSYKPGGPVTGSWGGSFLAIPKGNPDPEFVYQVIEYMQYDKAGLLDRYPSSGMLPPNISVYSDPSFDRPDERFGGQHFGQLQTYLARREPVLNMGDVFWDSIDDFDSVYPDIMKENISVEDGLSKVQEMAMERFNSR